jgi:imidazolonepropionase-like amidohydrolase
LGIAATIRAATAARDRARPGRHRGTIEPGRAADILVVDGDPLADPAILLDPARIAFVLKDGRIVAGKGAGEPPEPHA